MLRSLIAAALALVALASAADAKTVALHPRCNIDWPCVVATKSPQNITVNITSRREARQITRADRFRNVEFGAPIYPPETQKSFLGGDLVSKARQYIGGNPTGWRSLWCARFMAMIAPNAAARIRNPNWARDWASLPHVPPQIGAIAVLARGKRGGHVGVVSGFDAAGNPIIVSGNHGRRVGEGVYSAKRVLAYVSAS